MGTSLTGLTPATTYDALIKVGDNGPLSATAKYLSDGLGNDSPLSMSTSNVGIGTSTPATKLDVNGGSIFRGSISGFTGGEVLLNAGNNQQVGFSTNGTGTCEMFFDQRGTNFGIWNFRDLTATRMTINAGNVGIGTSTPPFKLSVSGSDTSNSYPTNASIHVINYEASNFGRTMGVNFAVGAGSLTEIIGGVYGVYTGYTTSTGGALSFVTNNGSGTLAEKARITSDGYLRLASGTGGIQFNGDTAAANALDDYEEGDFTMTVVPATSGTITLDNAVNQGRYTKIGRQVLVQGLLEVASVSLPVGTYVTINGLPFTIGSPNVDYNTRVGGAITVITGGSTLPYALQGFENQSNFRVNVDASTITAGSQFYISFSYTV